MRAGCQVAWFNEVSGFGLEKLNREGPVWRDTQIEVLGPAAVYIEGSFYRELDREWQSAKVMVVDGVL